MVFHPVSVLDADEADDLVYICNARGRNCLLKSLSSAFSEMTEYEICAYLA
jgi:hypothetical protein